jgi:NADH-quinone oxidoreductase subunit K
MKLLHLHEHPTIYLVVAAFLLAVGIYGLIRRRTLIGMLIAGEIIFSAASLNIMAVNRFMAPDPTVGQIFVLFIIAVYRNYRSIESAGLSELKG